MHVKTLCSTGTDRGSGRAKRNRKNEKNGVAMDANPYFGCDDGWMA